jgi:hypothetical protein
MFIVNSDHNTRKELRTIINAGMIIIEVDELYETI